jgi:hypothetical protein
MLRTRAAAPVSIVSAEPPWAFKPFKREDALDPETERLMRATEDVHRRLREDDIRRFSSEPRTVLGPRNLTLERLAAESVPALDRSFYINEPEGGARRLIEATLRASSTNILYYQDNSVATTNHAATAAEIDAVFAYYDQYGKSVIDDVFGGLGPAGTIGHFASGPRIAADIDGNGAFIILQLHPDNMLEGAAGYVTSCDRSPRPENRATGAPSCAGSNEGEMLYMLRPSSGFYLGTVVHEAKHISSHGYGRFANRGFNPSWIEEGTAEIAKEMSSRRAIDAADGTELRYAHIFPGGNVTNATYGMATVHSRARAFMQAAPLNGIIGNPNPNPNGSTYYGASWLFHRYLGDRYASAGYAAFFRQMNTTGVGISAIEAATGRSFAELLTEFARAVAVEGAPQAKQATTTRFRSYDFADVAGSMGSGTWPYLRGSGAFATGSTALTAYYSAPTYFEFTGNGSAFLRLDLFQTNGAPVFPTTDAVVTIVRVR